METYQFPGVVYWPPTRPNMPFQRQWKWHIPMACYGKKSRRRAGLTIWDKVKIPPCRHKVMHRKRVTCELHDSYFRLMTIKHAIPKTAEMTHSDGLLWRDIEWAIELLYNSVKTGSQLVWRPDPLVTRCGRGSQHPTEWAPGPSVEQPRRTGKKRGNGQ